MFNDVFIFDRDILCLCSVVLVFKIGKWFILNLDLNRLFKFNCVKGRWFKKNLGFF